ncbi:MAG: hypothetical protein Q8K70_02640 [Bacteroidota bacterium]|nr:hypothetical protein [Bacteroidota bacterium]
MKNSILLVLLSINLLPIKSQNNPPYWNGLIEWQTKYEESGGFLEKFSEEFLSHDGFKATGPNYVLSEILNKQYIPFIDSSFYITYTMPYRIKVRNIARQPDRKTYIDTMKIRLKFENGHCVSRQIKYTIIEPILNGYSQDIEYYETIESYFYKKYGSYQYNERVDSISISLSYKRIGVWNIYHPLLFTDYIKLNYEETDSLLYKRKGWNYSFSKLNSIFANSWGTNPQICVFHLSHYSMGLNQGLIYLFDPIHQWQAYDNRFFDNTPGRTIGTNWIQKERLYNNKFVGVNFTIDSQYVKQQSIFFF